MGDRVLSCNLVPAARKYRGDISRKRFYSIMIRSKKAPVWPGVFPPYKGVEGRYPVRTRKKLLCAILITSEVNSPQLASG
jgi:hypothetical protein